VIRALGLALLLLAAPARAATLFLSTEHPFLPDAPGAVVKLEVRGARSVDVRLYRLADPERYFLEERHLGRLAAARPALAHRAATVRRTPGSLALVREALAGAAEDARRAVDLGVGPATRALLTAAAQGPRKPKVTALPFLADLELVERWDLACAALESDFAYCDLEIGPRPAGAYLVEAASGGEMVHAVALFSTLSVIARRAPDQLVALAVDSRTGQPAAGASFALFAQGEAPARGAGGKAGLFAARLGDAPALLLARRGPEVAVVEVGAQSLAEPAPRALLVTDRGEYRPGEVLHFHGFARTGEERLAIPKAEEIEVAAYDARGSLFYRSRRPVSAQGGFSGEVVLEPELPQGLFRLVASVEGRPAGADFVVRRAPEPAFELEARLSLGPAGSPANAALRALLEGRPLKEAKVRWRVVRLPVESDLSASPEEIDRGEVTTDAEGRAELAFHTPPLDGRYELSLIGRDAAGRIALGGAAGIALRQPLRATVVAERRVVAPGSPATLQVRAFAEGERPAATQLRVRVLAAHGGAAGDEGPRQSVLDQTLRTDAGGAATFTFVPRATGYYEIELLRRDARLAETFLYVTTDGGDIPFSPDTLTLVPDKETYAVGETARVLVLSPFDAASALLTVEGAELARAEAVAIRGASAVLRVKVTSALAPGFTIAAQAIFNERSYRVERRIPVSPAAEALALTATLAAPDDRGELSVEVVDRAGKPVAFAELFATVQDERAAPPSAPPLLAFFYPERASLAQTASSTAYRSSDAGRPLARGAADGSEEGALPFKGLSQGRPRTRDDGSLLAAVGVTDARGRAHFAFAAPPTAPGLRAQVRAAAGPAFGEWSATLDRGLPPAELVLPRFLRAGDRATVRARLASSAPQEIALEGQGGEAKGAPEAALPVRGQGEEVSIAARFGSLGALKRTIPVLPAALEHALGESGTLAPGRSIALPLSELEAQERPRLFVTADPRATVLAARTASPGRRSSLTSFAIWRVLAQVAALRAGRVLTAPERATAVADVAALVGMAHPEGTFGAYDGAEDNVELSAPAVLALSLARDVGLDVEEGLLARGAARLRADPRRGALALWACELNDEAVPAALKNLLEADRSLGLTLSDRALLALDLDELGEHASAAETARRLERALRVSGGLACAGERCLEGDAPRASLRASALSALALEAVLPRSKLLPPLLRHLLTRRGAGDFGADVAGGFAALAVAGAGSLLPAGRATAAVETRQGRSALIPLSGPAEQSFELAGPSTLTAVGGPVYWRLARAARSAGGIVVEREIRPLGDLGEPEERKVRVGDRVQASLRLKTEQATGPVEIEDPYPAGIAPFEVEGERESFRQLDDRAQRIFGDDRVVFLLPGLRAGETTLRWEAVARVAGEYLLPPASAHAGELSGQSRADALVIEGSP
jgi:uncharacterized protein YfaS (alpha-2-macroglobulin family)